MRVPIPLFWRTLPTSATSVTSSVPASRSSSSSSVAPSPVAPLRANANPYNTKVLFHRVSFLRNLGYFHVVFVDSDGLRTAFFFVHRLENNRNHNQSEIWEIIIIYVLISGNFFVFLKCSISCLFLCKFISFLSAEYKVHTYNRNGLCALGFMDDHYPIRSAFSLLNQVRLRSLLDFCCFRIQDMLFVALEN